MAKKPTATQAANWARNLARKHITINVDNRYGGQCWDLPAYITIKYWGYFPPGNAIAWGYNRLPRGFRRYRNTPSFVPKPGDFAVWGTGSFNNGVGHVAIVVGPSTKSYFTSVDQNWRTANWSGSPSYFEKHSYYGISCFVRPPYRTEAKPKPKPKPKPKSATVKTKPVVKGNTATPTVEDTKPKYRNVKQIKYTTYDIEDNEFEGIYHFVVEGKLREKSIKGITIKNSNYMRSVSELYNDRNEYISERDYPHFYIDRNHIWAPRPIKYEKPGDPNNIVIEICGDLNDVKSDFVMNEVVGIVFGVALMNKEKIKIKESNVNIDELIWRSLKEHTGFDLIKDGKPTSKDIDKLIKAVLGLYAKRKEILEAKPKSVVKTKRIKVTQDETKTTISSTTKPSNSSTKQTKKVTKKVTKKSNKPKFTISKSGYSFSSAISAQMRAAPQVSNGWSWYHASRTQVGNAMNTSKIQNSNVQRYQMLNLGKYQGIPVSKLNQILRGRGTLSGQGKAVSQACKKYNLNEIYLISHAFLESGNGRSNFASGRYGIYNYFGIGAFDSNPNNAINFARRRGWTSPAKGIMGGAKFVRQDFINVGQNTLYRMRWNPRRPATHQYATDINWCRHQATSIYTLYKKIGLKGMYYIYDRYR